MTVFPPLERMQHNYVGVSGRNVYVCTIYTYIHTETLQIITSTLKAHRGYHTTRKINRTLERAREYVKKYYTTARN
jgi:hypothetical protein